MRRGGVSPRSAGVSARGGKLVGRVEAAGIGVAIRRQGGHANLLLEVLMRNGNKRPARLVDAGTRDVERATEHALALAGELAAQTGMAADEPILRPATYAQLFDEIERRGTNTQNFKSQLRSWMRTFAFAEEDEVGDEFGVMFEVYLENFRAALRREGKAEPTISPYLSRIGKLRTIVSGLLSADTSDRTFGQVLTAAMRAKGVTDRRVASVAGVCSDTVRLWRKNRFMPSRDARQRIPAVEILLGLPVSTLSTLLPPVRHATRRKGGFAAELRVALRNAGFSILRAAREIGVSNTTLRTWCNSTIPIDHHREVSIPRLEVLLGVQPGALSSILPPVPITALRYARRLTAQQQQEWGRLEHHKTYREGLDQDRRPLSYWRKKSDGSCGSADLFHGEMRRYYGFLALPEDLADPRNSGRGREHDQLSLADLACREQLQSFIEFRAKRTGYNEQTRTFLCFVTSLLNAGTGYLWQGNGFNWRSFPRHELECSDVDPASDITMERWREHCELLHAKIEQWLKHLHTNRLIKRTRTYDHIGPILKAQHPIDYLVRLELEMKRDLDARWKRLGRVERARDVRDLLLVSMMIQNPLRAQHWEMMTWREDDPRSHLIKTEGGNFVLRYAMEDFKSFSGSREEDYEAEVNPRLTQLIDEYLYLHRPHLVGADCCDYVFRPSHPVRGREPHERFSIYSRFVKLTRTHLGEMLTRGFGPHGVRHVIATELVKNEDEGIQLAADALHNTPEMIKNHYGHLRSIDRTNRARRIVGSALAGARERLGVTE